ncbi:MAG TPA: hypothetical protein VJ551_02475 [Nitrososphaeraceae archaeon]|nr:hypothetical protein [Nitrososphaeraceae archaeon]
MGESQEKAKIEAENRKKELEIKVDIVSKMAEICGSALGPSYFIYLREKTISTPAEKEAVNEVANKILTDVFKVYTLLRSYKSEENIIKAWEDYERVLVRLTFASSFYLHKDRSPDEKVKLASLLIEINKYLSNNNLIDDFSDDIKKKWERLTTDKTLTELWTFDSNLWEEVADKLSNQGDKIIENFLNSCIKIS